MLSPNNFVSVDIIPSDGYMLMIDTPCHGSVLVHGMPVSLWGWLIHQEKPIADVALYQNGVRLKSIRLCHERPGVRRHYPNWYGIELPGFQDEFAFGDESAEVSLIAQEEDGRAVKLAAFGIKPIDIPKKVLFMHIAKTAGSSVNRFFSERIGSDYSATHIESNPLLRSDSGLTELREKRYLSGHIALRELVERFQFDDYFSCVTLRHPVEHVMSHIAYVRRLADAGNEAVLEVHALHIQELAKQLASVDLSNPEVLNCLLKDLSPVNKSLLDNTQTRYLTTDTIEDGVSETHLASAIVSLKRFSLVGFTESMSNFFSSASDALGWEKPASVVYENVGSNKYGLSTEASDQIAALFPLIKYDLELYAMAKDMYGSEPTARVTA